MIIKPSLCLLLSVLTVQAQSDQESFITRELPWDGSEALVLNVPAAVRFIQAPGPGSVVVTGPRRSVETFKVTGGVLQDRMLRTGTRLTIVVTAPRVTRFSAQGGGTLTIEGFDQDELHIATTGRADIKATGRAGTITLNLRGFGWADLSQLEAQGAEIELTGARKAIIAPTAWASLSGNGTVVLLTKPAMLTRQGRTNGRVIHAYPPVAREI